jgi:hypothetical protein
VDWVHVVYDRHQWRNVIRTAVNLQVPQNEGNSFKLDEKVLVFPECLCSVELLSS